MLVQYPHILKFNLVTGGSEEIDENGDTVIVPGATTTIEVTCRFEPNADGATVPSNDGVQLNFGWIVYMESGQVEIPEGIEVKGFEASKQIASGTVKRYNKGQLNARAWV